MSEIANMLRNAVTTLASITAAASMLAQHDLQSLKIAKEILEALRARCETEKRNEGFRESRVRK